MSLALTRKDASDLPLSIQWILFLLKVPVNFMEASVISSSCDFSSIGGKQSQNPPLPRGMGSSTEMHQGGHRGREMGGDREWEVHGENISPGTWRGAGKVVT